MPQRFMTAPQQYKAFNRSIRFQIFYKVSDLGSFKIIHMEKNSSQNIPNQEGISAVKVTYERYPETSVATKVIITFLARVISLNKVMFKCKNFLQIRYCAICTVFAPSYANIFLIRFEEKYLAISKEKIELYARY